jgi:hypothetical protein
VSSSLVNLADRPSHVVADRGTTQFNFLDTPIPT